MSGRMEARISLIEKKVDDPPREGETWRVTLLVSVVPVLYERPFLLVRTVEGRCVVYRDGVEYFSFAREQGLDGLAWPETCLLFLVLSAIEGYDDPERGPWKQIVAPRALPRGISLEQFEGGLLEACRRFES